MGQAMPLIALPIFAPQRTADAAALKMQPAYRPKNCRRIKSCSSAYYGLLDLPQAKGFPADSLQPFLRRSQKGRIRFFPAPSRSYRGLFVFPRKSCSSACPTYFRNREFRRAAKYPMPAIFRRKASQNILTATLMPPIYGVQRGFLLPGIIIAAEILPRTAKNIFRFRRSELLLSLILKLLRITCLQSPFPLPEVNIAKAKR